MYGLVGLGRRCIYPSVARWGILRKENLSTDASPNYNFKTLLVSKPSNFVYNVEINRPEKLNSFNKDFWREISECFSLLGEDNICRAIVLSGKGKLFTSGIDLSDLAEMGSIVTSEIDIARKARTLKGIISKYQDSLSSLEKCPKPVIAAVHGACIGAGVDLICSADIRYCSSDAWFQVKEVEVGLAADVGTLQRLPKILGSESLVRELCFTARKLYSSEAMNIGFVSRVFSDRETLVSGAIELASVIAEKSPVAVQTTKQSLVHARDHTVQEGLDYMSNVNMALLQSEDLMTSAMAIVNKKKPEFSNY